MVTMLLGNRWKFQVGSEIVDGLPLKFLRAEKSFYLYLRAVTYNLCLQDFHFLSILIPKRRSKNAIIFKPVVQSRHVCRGFLSFLASNFGYVEFLGGMTVRVDEVGDSSTSNIRQYNGGGRLGEMSKDSDSCFESVDGVKQLESLTNLSIRF